MSTLVGWVPCAIGMKREDMGVDDDRRHSFILWSDETRSEKDERVTNKQVGQEIIPN